MEGVPKQENNIESLANWRELREQAPTTAGALVEAAGTTLTAEASVEKSNILYELIQNLSAQDDAGKIENNANRFVVEVLAQQLSLDTEELKQAAAEAAEAKKASFPAEPPADYPRRESVIYTSTDRTKGFEAQAA